MLKVLQLDPRDNVLIALDDLRPGEAVSFGGKTWTLATSVPRKHKFVTGDLGSGDPVIMYGVLVGRSREPIPEGAAITVANLRHDSGAFTATRHPQPWTPPDTAAWAERHFLGYHRADGQVGTRNYWLVVPLVFCENRNVAALRQAFEEELGYAAPSKYRRQVAHLARLYREGFPDSLQTTGTPPDLEDAPRPLFEHVDGLRFLMHEGGCGGTRDDSGNLCALIAGYLHHPNVAGATVLSLGCQHAQSAILMDELRRRDPHFSKPLVVLDQQSAGTESALMDRAIRETFSGLVEADRCRRVPAPLGSLTIGLKCGGSDGFSGISANPAIGHTADLLAALSGKALLAEFPELCGVEQSLIDRCATQEAADKFVALMRDYYARARAVRSGLEMNPSPGNIQDGLITDAMKSAGAARKSGTSPVTDVLDYPEYAVTPGLNLLCTPGNDVECVTGQVAAGASIVLFTTGLGTPTGNPIAPVVKIASNTALARRMPDIIDIDTGPVIAGEATTEQMGEQILSRVLDFASGTAVTRAEQLGQYDFIPWKRGVSL
ncbi:MAG TPA: altronate dehydratase family protein [Acidobacteriaceae bacterium]|nr:altronate dehydratase family protein [Acidobacteriaceae bacterium]